VLLSAQTAKNCQPKAKRSSKPPKSQENQTNNTGKQEKISFERFRPEKSSQQNKFCNLAVDDSGSIGQCFNEEASTWT
jgi:hypothetical protein